MGPLAHRIPALTLPMATRDSSPLLPREPLSTFRKLAQIFSDENNHLSSREILSQVQMGEGPRRSQAQERAIACCHNTQRPFPYLSRMAFLLFVGSPVFLLPLLPSSEFTVPGELEAGVRQWQAIGVRAQMGRTEAAERKKWLTRGRVKKRERCAEGTACAEAG